VKDENSMQILFRKLNGGDHLGGRGVGDNSDGVCPGNNSWARFVGSVILKFSRIPAHTADANEGRFIVACKGHFYV
jgi:hypothetical protein